MIKKKSMVALVSLAMFSAHASADKVIGFDGGYVGGSVTAATLSVSANNIDRHGDRQLGMGIQLGYNFNISQQFNLGLEASYNKDIGEITGGQYRLKINDAAIISIMPGYKIDNNSLVYMKLGRGEINARATHLTTRLEVSDTEMVNVFGLGYKAFVSDNISLNLEFSRMSIDTDVDDVDVDIISLGMQYNF